MISMPWVLHAVLLIDIANGIKTQVTSSQNKDIRKSIIFQINATIGFFQNASLYSVTPTNINLSMDK